MEGGIGEWGTCAGASQVFANISPDGSKKKQSATAAKFYGYLGADMHVNAMSTIPCSKNTDYQGRPLESCGVARNIAMHGWRGSSDGSKAFLIEIMMPNVQGARNQPAIWVLNARVVHGGSFSCNCRGMGPDGRCGELDIMETLKNGSQECFSEIYSFKGATGSGAEYFQRPTKKKIIVAVIFDASLDSIQIVQLNSKQFQFGKTLTKKEMQEWRNIGPNKEINFVKNLKHPRVV